MSTKVRVTLMAYQTIELEVDHFLVDRVLTAEERERAHLAALRVSPPWRIVDVYTPKGTK